MPPKRKQHSKVACCNVYLIGQNMQAWSNHNISELGLRALWFLQLEQLTLGTKLLVSFYVEICAVLCFF